MKKIIATVLGAALALSAVSAQTVLKVGATPSPHAEILNLVKDDLKAQGIDLKVVEFTDYVTPNEALNSGDIDANYFQHLPYLESFNKDRNFNLVNAGGIHIEPLALYSGTKKGAKKYAKLADLKAKSKIAIPNDPTNEGRALLLLQSAGLITLKANAGLTATTKDIATNPKKLKFVEVEAASLPRVLADVDAAVINGNYALDAGLSASKDGLFVEGADSPYVNIIAVKKGKENDPAIQALVNALKSDKVKNWIKAKYPNGDVVAVF
ncbi:MAG: MetQ/NlpA family ABC transporter substrate-binding protein [Treponema sp.]|nr:MetQ/NlpA family ABC transporter substrate-binding protein [Treponema sp.]